MMYPTTSLSKTSLSKTLSCDPLVRRNQSALTPASTLRTAQAPEQQQRVQTTTPPIPRTSPPQISRTATPVTSYTATTQAAEMRTSKPWVGGNALSEKQLPQTHTSPSAPSFSMGSFSHQPFAEQWRPHMCITQCLHPSKAIASLVMAGFPLWKLQLCGAEEVQSWHSALGALERLPGPLPQLPAAHMSHEHPLQLTGNQRTPAHHRRFTFAVNARTCSPVWQ